MSASMLDEVQMPEKPPRLWICPCCVFSFSKKAEFLAHCEQMKARIDEAIAKARP